MRKSSVLLADDHAVVRAGIRKALEELPGIEIVGEVGDGPALFSALFRSPPDCLLIDVTMPDFEPISAIAEIRHRFPTMKILVISAYDDDVYVQGLLRAGVDGYHLKDQPLSDLRLAVQRVLAGEKWICSPLLDKIVHYMETEGQTAPSPLTDRQRDILRLLCEGYDNQSIARQLALSVKTVENHLTRLYRRLNVQSRLEAANYVMRHPEVLGTAKARPQDSPATLEIPDQERFTVLVVDDNVRYRYQLRRMIGKVCRTAQVQEAENIAEAAQIVQRTPPRLALIDVILGDENGIQCARRLRALSPSSRIVLISAYPDREFHRLGLEAGALAFLDKKDLDTTTLRQIIEDVIA